MPWNKVDNLTGPQGPPGPTDTAALDLRYVNVAGDTMTGALVLPGDPLNPLEAAPKQYVDGRTTSATQYNAAWSNNTAMADPTKGRIRANNVTPINATQLALSAYDSDNALHLLILQLVPGDEVILYLSASLANWVKFQIAGPITNNSDLWVLAPVTRTAQGGTFAPANGAAIEVVLRTGTGSYDVLDQAEADARYVNLTGDTMTAPLVLPGNPSSALQAAPKQYVDQQIAALPVVPKFARGNVTVSYAALNAAVSGSVTFPAGRFTTVPTVVATILSNAPLQFSPATVLAKTTSGFTVYLAKIAGAASGSVNVDWIAIED